MFKKIINSVNNIASIVTVIQLGTYFSLYKLNATRKFLETHGLLGWGLLFLILGALPIILKVFIIIYLNKGTRLKDHYLVVELLGDWGTGSKFQLELNNISHDGRIKYEIIESLNKRIYSWEVEGRKIRNIFLRRKFDKFRKSVSAYVGATVEMNYLDLGPGTQPNYDYVAIPREWKGEQPARYSSTLRDLTSKRIDLLSNLLALQELDHRLSPR